jgi:hypothetical protein
MSCRNFETIITELARGQMLEARAKEDALAHMETCKSCARRFANEQTLTVGLRAVAASTAITDAPAHVEAALLSAFRQPSASPFVPAIAPAQSKSKRWMGWSIAAAAMILIASTFAITRLLPISPREESAKRNAPVSQSSPASSQTVTVKEPDVPAPGMLPVVVEDNPYQRPSVPQRFTGVADRRRGTMRDARMSNRQIGNAAIMENAANTSEEIATDFLPLTYGGNLSQLDDGQVVRVELPRSALHSFGLPVNAERVGERVKADVLLGHDGVARAIRFVR